MRWELSIILFSNVLVGQVDVSTAGNEEKSNLIKSEIKVINICKMKHYRFYCDCLWQQRV